MSSAIDGDVSATPQPAKFSLAANDDLARCYRTEGLRKYAEMDDTLITGWFQGVRASPKIDSRVTPHSARNIVR